jgi:hypothetical protein
MSALSSAAADLGVGSSLVDQVKEETDEERKKRLARADQMRLLGPAAMALGLTGTGALGG